MVSKQKIGDVLKDQLLVLQGQVNADVKDKKGEKKLCDVACGLIVSATNLTKILYQWN